MNWISLEISENWRISLANCVRRSAERANTQFARVIRQFLLISKEIQFTYDADSAARQALEVLVGYKDL